MLRACIADDEKYVLESIRERIRQSGLEIQVTGTASNGRDAFELYEREKPDIFFVDIQMPFCSGLDFVERVRESDKDSITKFIIISGYDDFSYMKRAIKTSVVNYILKPIQQEEFLETLKEICEELKAVRGKLLEESRKNIRLLQDFLEESPRFTGTAFLIWGEELLKKIKEYGDRENENLFYEKLPDGEWRHIRFYESENLILCLKENEYLTEKEVYSLWEGIRMYTGKHSVLVYRLANEENLDRITEEMGTSMNRRFWEKEIHIFRSEKDRTVGEIDIEGIGNGLENVREKAWEKELEEKYGKIFKGDYRENGGKLVKLYHSLLILTANKYTVHNFEVPEKLKEELYPQVLAKYENREAVLRAVKGHMTMFHEKLVKEAEKSGLIEQVAGYLELHYEEELNLQDIANEFFVAPNYLTRRFKEKKGITAMQYLENYRMEKAEELLRSTNLNVTEIAGACGYSDANYFTRTFKKRNGMSPRKYREG